MKGKAVLVLILSCLGAQACSFARTQEVSGLEICTVRPKATSPLPQPGQPVLGCIAKISFDIADVHENEIDGLVEFSLEVTPRAEKQLLEFLKSHQGEQAVLVSSNRSVVNLMIVGSDASKLIFSAESGKEADRVRSALSSEE